MTTLQRRALLLAPLGVAAAAAASAFWVLLERMREGTYDPHGVPSMLIGKPLPSFSLPGLPPSQGLLQRRRHRHRPPSAGQLLRLLVHPLRPGGAGADGAEAARHADLGHRLQGQARRHRRRSCNRTAIPTRASPATSRATRRSTSASMACPRPIVIDRSGIVRWRWAGGLSEDIVRQSLGPLLQSLA